MYGRVLSPPFRRTVTVQELPAARAVVVRRKPGAYAGTDTLYAGPCSDSPATRQREECPAALAPAACAWRWRELPVQVLTL